MITCTLDRVAAKLAGYGRLMSVAGLLQFQRRVDGRVGASDKNGAFPADNPVSPGAFAATLYHCLGVPADAEIPHPLGRPTKVAEGQPVRALLC